MQGKAFLGLLVRARLLLMLLLCLACALGWQNFQLATTPQTLLRQGQTLRTADDPSYLRPIDQWKQQGFFPNSGLQGRLATVRPPGYGLWYGLHLTLFPEPEQALLSLRISQALLQGLALFLLLLWAVDSQPKWRVFWALPLLLLPFLYGFSAYTLSEGISPFLLGLGLFFLREHRQKAEAGQRPTAAWLYGLLAAFAFGLLWLVRPALLPLVLAFVPLVYRRWKQGLFLLALALLPLSGWLLRNQVLFGLGLNLHPIYQNELPGQYREPHAAAWRMFKGWEHLGWRFHETMDETYRAAMAGESDTGIVGRCLRQTPELARSSLGTAALSRAYVQYVRAVQAQRPFALSGRLMPSQLLAAEAQSVAVFDSLAGAFRQQQPLRYFLITPAKVAGELLLHSNLNAYYFQHTGRGQWGVEWLRILCVFVHATAFILLGYWLWLGGPQRWFFAGICLYLCYLVFVQRGIEERYTFPLLAPVLLYGWYKIPWSRFWSKRG